MSFSATWMHLEIIILSQSDKDKYHMTSLVCGIFILKMIKINLFTKQKQNNMLWSMRRLEKNFQTWGRMRQKLSLWEGDALRTAGQLKGEQHWTRVLSPLLYPGYKEWDRGLAGHLLVRGGMYTGSGKRRADTVSLWGGRGDGLYCFIIVTARGREGQ